MWVSLDAGLRPDEVRKAKVGWADTSNGVLRIPKKDASKVEANWSATLTDRTAEGLARWIAEREQHARYDDTDRLWLTSHGNPWSSKSLGRLLRRLCEQADIDHEHRKMSWYAIRHSVGTHMSDERGLEAARDQLRYKSKLTTMKYDNVSHQDRRDALDRMG